MDRRLEESDDFVAEFAKIEDETELRRKYHEYALRIHPDLNPSSREESNIKMQSLNAAKEEALLRICKKVELSKEDVQKKERKFSAAAIEELEKITKIKKGTYNGNVQYGYSPGSGVIVPYADIFTNPAQCVDFLISFSPADIKITIDSVKKIIDKLLSPQVTEGQLLLGYEQLFKYFTYWAYGFNILDNIDKQINVSRRAAMYKGLRSSQDHRKLGTEKLQKDIASEKGRNLDDYEKSFTDDFSKISDSLERLSETYTDSTHLKSLAALFNRIYGNSKMKKSLALLVSEEDQGAQLG